MKHEPSKPAARLLFVGGFPSGGTDLLKTILNAHPEIKLAGELPLLHKLAEYGYRGSDILSKKGEYERFCTVLEKLDVYSNLTPVAPDTGHVRDPDLPMTLEQALCTCLRTGDGMICGSKTPQFTENAAEISSLFPHASFIFVTRDVRDVCLSWKSKWGKSMALCADKWAARMMAGAKFSDSMPASRVMFVRYEDILGDLNTCCRKICEFLGLEFSARMLSHHVYTTEAVAGKRKYGQELDSGNSKKWATALSRNKVRRIEQIAGQTMLRFGYAPEYSDRSKPLSRIERYVGQAQNAFATLLIGNRELEGTERLRSRFTAFALEFKKRVRVR